MNLSGFSSGEFEIVRDGSGTLTVRHSKGHSVLNIVVMIAFVAVWYWLALDKPQTLGGAVEIAREKLSQDGPSSWLFLTLPLVGLGSMLVYQTRVAMLSGKIRLDGRSNMIQYGRKQLSFNQVAKVRFQHILGGEGPDEYLVSLNLVDGDALHIVSHFDRERVLAVAADIADMLGTQVEKS